MAKLSRRLPHLVAALFLPPTLAAQELANRVDIHGFGGWSYGKTDRNVYLSGSPEGSHQHGSFALNLIARPSRRLTIASQLFWQQTDEETESMVDFAFAEWRASDALRFRAGKVKQPFGVYTEIFDVGTVRPFFALPQSLYGPTGFVAEAYQGIGLRGDAALGKGWGLAYDLYGGSLGVIESRSPIAFFSSTTEPDHEPTRDLLGARTVLATPLSGLSVGVSGYTGRRKVDDGLERHRSLGSHLSYTSDRVWLRSELARVEDGDEEHTIARYIEGAYFINNVVQVSALVDEAHVTLEGLDVSRAPSLARHRDRALGVNLWFSPESVIKASLHVVRGNRLAGPPDDELPALVASGGLTRTTRLVHLGVQFSF